MKNKKEALILNSVRKQDPPKKRVTFFISIESKNAFKRWCEKNAVTESGAVEALIRDVVPQSFFKPSKK